MFKLFFYSSFLCIRRLLVRVWPHVSFPLPVLISLTSNRCNLNVTERFNYVPTRGEIIFDFQRLFAFRFFEILAFFRRKSKTYNRESDIPRKMFAIFTIIFANILFHFFVYRIQHRFNARRSRSAFRIGTLSALQRPVQVRQPRFSSRSWCGLQAYRRRKKPTAPVTTNMSRFG